MPPEARQSAESVRDTDGMEPCAGSFVGRVVTEHCDACGHMLCVHLADFSCSLCALIQYLTDPENCITPPTQSDGSTSPGEGG